MTRIEYLDFERQSARSLALPDEVLTLTSIASGPPSSSRFFLPRTIAGKSQCKLPELTSIDPDTRVLLGNLRVTLPDDALARTTVLGAISFHWAWMLPEEALNEPGPPRPEMSMLPDEVLALAW